MEELNIGADRVVVPSLRKRILMNLHKDVGRGICSYEGGEKFSLDYMPNHLGLMLMRHQNQITLKILRLEV